MQPHTQRTNNGGQLHPQFVTPYPGIKVRYGGTPPAGHVLLRYELRQPGCCECENLSVGGWIAVVILFLFFWPLCWIPFVCPACYSEYQVPIYGVPSDLGVYNVRQYPVAQPYQQQQQQPYPSSSAHSGPAMGIPVSGQGSHSHHYPSTAPNPYAPPPQQPYPQYNSASPAEPSAPQMSTAFVSGDGPSSTAPAYKKG
mmetsp:Transcript_35112/g.62589  ORF Transcript_35112/g.62589 Transcript_35112/m.62589 type:complete len:198 (-) Transcript_35112:1086-1679(-)